MKCPNCGVDLLMAERQGVEIDYCSQCRGVWLDRGELDKILERATAECEETQARTARTSGSDSPAAPEERSHADSQKRDDRQHGRKKPSSFFTDIFEGFGD